MSKTLQNITDDEFAEIIKSSLTWNNALTKCGLKNKTRKFEIRIDNLSEEHIKHLPINYGGLYSKIEKYSNEYYKDLIEKSNNWDEVFNKLDLKISHQILENLKKHLTLLNINYEHLTINNKIKRVKKNILEDILVENSIYSGSMSAIKKRLINELGWIWECSWCNKSTHFTHWTGEVKIPLQVDHINGDRKNNSIENLRLLCSTCHSLTPTYCGKNIKKEMKLK
jgi:5-methylcytosine-specific restriction endonuclease McrA